MAESSEWKVSQKVRKPQRFSQILSVLSKTERIKAAVGHITQPDCIPWKTEKSPPRNRNNWDDPCRETIKTNREFSIVLAQGFLTFRNRISALLGLGPVLIRSSNWIQWFLLVKRFRPFKIMARLPPWTHSEAIQVLLQTQSSPVQPTAELYVTASEQQAEVWAGVTQCGSTYRTASLQTTSHPGLLWLKMHVTQRGLGVEPSWKLDH